MHTRPEVDRKVEAAKRDEKMKMEMKRAFKEAVDWIYNLKTGP